MNQKYFLELLLFLTEIKSKNNFKGRNLWELEKHITFVKGLIENIDNGKPINKEKQRNILSGIIQWIVRFLISP